jgi:hypothetical protein
MASLTTMGVLTPVGWTVFTRMRGEVVGVGAHEAHHAVLGRGVAEAAAGRAADAVDAGRGTGQHDRAALAALDHGRDGRLDGVQHAGQVDVDHVLPGVVRLVQRHGRDAGVGQHNVHRPELGHPGVERRPQPRLVPDVGLLGHDPPVEGLDFLGRLGQVIGRRHRVRHGFDLPADVNGDDVRAFLREPDRVAAALAARGAGDEGDFAFQLSHD